MGLQTKISWCDHTVNLWRGCTHVSDGCKFCYAEALGKRNPGVLGEWGPGGRRVLGTRTYWEKVLGLNRKAQRKGRRRRVFAFSLADWLDPWSGALVDVDGRNVVRDAEGRWHATEGVGAFASESLVRLHDVRAAMLVLIRRTPDLDWLLLTKRPEHWRTQMEILAADPARYGDGAEIARQWLNGQTPPNIWFGVSAEDQDNFRTRVPIAAEIPAACHFVSYEPALGPLDLLDGGVREVATRSWTDYGDEWDSHVVPLFDWLIAGGESGPHARPFALEWARSVRDQCRDLGIAFHLKQLGAKPVGFTPGVGLCYLDLTDKSGKDESEWPADLRGLKAFPDVLVPTGGTHVA